MQTNHYATLIYDKINNFIMKAVTKRVILERDVYDFLEMLQTITRSTTLEKVDKTIVAKLASLESEGEDQWPEERLKQYLIPLLLEVSANKEEVLADISEVSQIIEIKSHEKDFILIIDDDVIFMSYIKKILEAAGYSVIIAHNGKRGIELIYELQPALVFLDTDLPDIDGFAILKSVGKIKKDRTFITMTSSYNAHENEIRAYELGAMDFIAKPVKKDILLAYVANRLGYRKEMEKAIIIDELTRVYNRKYFESQLGMMIKQYEREKLPFSVAIIDLDYFKKVNDDYGHLVGDQVLKRFAEIIMSEKRKADIFSRYGGEEFVMIFPYTHVKTAQLLVNDLREKISASLLINREKQLKVTFSAGVMEINESYMHRKTLLEAADKALYTAKTQGRNQTVIYNESLELVSKRNKLKVVVVDDVQLIREIVTNHFAGLPIHEQFDIEVIAYTCGESFLAADWYESDSNYVILLDWVLPKMSGIDVLKEIRKDYSSNQVIVSMLTSRTGEDNVLEAFRNGADDYIRKPFKVADISTRMINLAEKYFLVRGNAQ